MARLRALVCAAQDVKRELRGGPGAGKTYQQTELAGVTTKNWWKGYAHHWEAVREIFDRLDVDVLLKASKKTKPKT
ncbi:MULTISPECIES: bacteriophage antitermination protein Q [Cronobacter]|uniref:bacteriophage antitermination protein Q n=1 Tax=Cronobacter TaxID=413496 RepID=UPI0021021367|nr:MULTISPECIES: bacteriophage antitermination protein Q [Cronobacter]MDK1186563.1 bacteriophage antitermination protein Q [Cronobacter turicensis]MDK1208226.1 bacteriophage antitermination protein Q [Cronobacter turicensis]MDK1216588.1 bacteriophage antitermination protein Q [Cronobacter turicensis]MDK1220966.1 bacteriophage antitermination protein Q [Cronobacter turicensis]MDK1233805.1 bacteriophage antitermination protein Q [Cronobacter turicensis]